MHVAMIGATHPHSAMYLESLDSLDEVDGVVLSDADPAALRDVGATVRKLVGVEERVGGVLARADVTHAVVAVPTDQSPSILRQVIGAGKHVLTEKPAARSAAEIVPVLEALRERPMAFAVAFLNRRHPALQQMRELYRGGAIGRLVSVELRMVTTQVRFRDPGHWLFRREVSGGGILSWLGCHWFDMVRYVTGEEYTSVSAQLATLSGEPIDVEDTAAVSFRLTSGAVGSMHAGYLLATGRPGYRGGAYDIALHLRGTHGAVSFRRGERDEPLVLDTNAPGWAAASPRVYDFALPPSPGYGGRHGLDFIRDWLQAGPSDPTPAGAEDTLRLLELLDAIYDAGASGRTVEVSRRTTA